jgi:hypothetical protein
MKEPKEIYLALVKAGDAMAEDQYTYRLLDSSTKSVLAQLTIEAKNIEQCSMAEATQIALSTNLYRDHLKACAEASRIAEKSKIGYYSTRAYSDHCRTAEASHRASMSIAP